MACRRSIPTAVRSWRTLGFIAGLAAMAGQASAQDLQYAGAGLAVIMENQVNVAASVPATYFGMIGNQWGYGGIQMNQDTATRSAIFSIWDTAEETTEYAYNATLPITKHGRFGGEGTGAQFLFNNNWKYGTDYRVAYRCFAEPDGAHVRFSGFYYDPAASAWTYVVTYRANTGGVALDLSQFYAFTENYGDTWGDRTATLSNAWGYVPGTGWQDLTGGWIFNIPPGDQPSQTDRPDYGAILTGPGGFTIHSDTDPAIRTQAEWDAVAYTPTAAEAPIVIPYFLSCGSVNALGNWEPDGYVQDLAGDSVLKADPVPVATAGVREPAPQAVYQNSRQGSGFQYNLVGFMPGADYWVRLHFQEDTYAKAGSRLENVTINGAAVLTGFDILKQAGGMHKAVARSFQAKADAKGQIVVAFAPAKGSPVQTASVCGIAATTGQPTFLLEPSAAPIPVMRGFGTTAQETVVGLNGFNSPVALSVVGLPYGLTAKVTPDPVTFNAGGCLAQVNLALTASLAAPLLDDRQAWILATSVEGTRVLPFRLSIHKPVPTFVQASESPYTDAADSVQATYAGAQVQGDLNVLAVQWQDATASVASVTDTSGNAYVLAAGPTRNLDQAGSTQAIYYATGIHAAPAGGNTVTVTFDSAATYPDVLIADYAGVKTLVNAASATGTSVAIDSGPLTEAGGEELLFSAVTVTDWTDAPGTGFTQRFQSDWGNVIQDQVITKAGTYDATATQNDGVDWIIQAVTFK